MQTCKLCSQQKQLIKKSHIIPEFMYQELFDEHHQMISFDIIARSRGEGHIKRPPTGEYEGGLLCRDCEILIGAYETYASKAIYGGALHKDECPTCFYSRTPDGVEFTHCKNMNYKKIKIFFLSILWRASISSRPFFKDISLGAHEDIIRKMIFNGDPGDVTDYPIVFSTFANDKEMSRDLILTPEKRVTNAGNTTYVFIIGGMIYVYYLSNKGDKVPSYVLTETIKPNNEMNILHIPKGKAWNVIFGYIGLSKNT